MNFYLIAFFLGMTCLVGILSLYNLFSERTVHFLGMRDSLKGIFYSFIINHLCMLPYVIVILSIVTVINGFRLLWLGKEYDFLTFNFFLLSFINIFLNRMCRGIAKFDVSKVKKGLMIFGSFTGNLLLLFTLFMFFFSSDGELFSISIYSLLIMVNLSLIDFARIGLQEVVKK
jgi:hypothetical protein